MPTACILQSGAHVRLRSERLQIWAPSAEGGTLQHLRDIPVHDVERVILKEGAQISS